MQPRGRSASAVVFGLQGQERTDEDAKFARGISFKLNSSVDFVISEEAEELESEEESEEEIQYAPAAGGFVQPARRLLRNRSNDALAGLGAMAIAANQSPLTKRGYTKTSNLVVREGSAVPTPPKTPLPSSEKPGSRIQWKTHDGSVSVTYDGEGMTYLCNLYPQGPGSLSWRADVEWAGGGVRVEGQQMKFSFSPRSGWKFGSCDGLGILTLTPPKEGKRERKRKQEIGGLLKPEGANLYDGMVEGPGAPGPQIHMNLDTAAVSTPAPMLRAHGKGRMAYANGDKYDGQWVRNHREGQGKHTAYGGLHQGVYAGAWAKDMRNGAGRYTDKDGNILMGRWENNVPREGIMEWANGEIYDGWWSGKCEYTNVEVTADAHTGRCGRMASFGPAGGVRCLCDEHKKDSHVSLDPYRRDGHGTMKWPDGGVYQGQWANDARHHKGVMRYGSSHEVWSDGDVYEGLWRLDEIADGFVGTMAFADGGMYDGKWWGGVQHNEGIYTAPNGDLFDGEFERGARRNGPGKMKYANGDIYIGSWVADVRDGQGTMEYANGDEYSGLWAKGMHADGQRKFVETGHVYDGEWENDVPHGHGKMTYGSDWKEGSADMKDGDIFEGPWEDGKHAVGEAFIIYNNGDSYRGGYERSLRHGTGRMEYAHGNIFEGTWVRGSRREGWVRAQIPQLGTYEGDWKDEHPHGIGAMQFEDTGSYDGGWLRGQRHGEGTMSNGPWRSYTGEWLFDRFHGQGILTDLRSCSTYTGEFAEGMKHGDGHEAYGFIDASFQGHWEKEVKRKGIFTFPDGTRWERTYDETGKLQIEMLLGDKLTWKTAAAYAFTNSRKLLGGDQEQISVGEMYANQDCVADPDTGRPIKTPSILPHISSSPYQNMGRQPPVALTSARRATASSAQPVRRMKMTNADLPSFLRQKTTRNLSAAIHDAAEASRLSKQMDWGMEEVEKNAEELNQRTKESTEAVAERNDAHNERLSQREIEAGERASQHAATHAAFVEKRNTVMEQAEARKAETEEKLAQLGTLNTEESVEDVNRSSITLNANGSLKPHSGNPELWQIESTEVDLEVHYNMGGQLWYVQNRVLKTIEDGGTIKGKPMNKRAVDANRDYDPDLVIEVDENTEANAKALALLNLGRASRTDACYHCGKPGHWKKECPDLHAMLIQRVWRGHQARARMHERKLKEPGTVSSVSSGLSKKSSVNQAMDRLKHMEEKKARRELAEKQAAIDEAEMTDLLDGVEGEALDAKKALDKGGLEKAHSTINMDSYGEPKAAPLLAGLLHVGSAPAGLLEPCHCVVSLRSPLYGTTQKPKMRRSCSSRSDSASPTGDTSPTWARKGSRQQSHAQNLDTAKSLGFIPVLDHDEIQR